MSPHAPAVPTEPLSSAAAAGAAVLDGVDGFGGVGGVLDDAAPERAWRVPCEPPPRAAAVADVARGSQRASHPAPHPAPHPALARVRAWTGALLKLGVVSIVGYALMFNFSVVRGSSMAPSIHDGDRILVDHLSYVFQSVRRGDIVVLRYPLDPSVDYIKRVVGLPGDEVVIEGGHVWVNGVLAEEANVVPDLESRLVTHVLADHYFVLGDNRPNSSDSREFGPVPREYLRGRVDLRVWPIERAGAID